jgi:hypothetical protein
MPLKLALAYSSDPQRFASSCRQSFSRNGAHVVDEFAPKQSQASQKHRQFGQFGDISPSTVCLAYA